MSVRIDGPPSSPGSPPHPAMTDLEDNPYSSPTTGADEVPGLNRGRRTVFFVLFALVLLGCMPMVFFFGLGALAIPFVVGPALWFAYDLTSPKAKNARSVAADTGTTTCPKCGSMMTDRHELLLGDSDAVTTQYACHNCDHKWS